MSTIGEAMTAPSPDATIVTCVEAGPLERQVVLLARTLRAFAGRWAACPIAAVTPRRGLPLKSSTLRDFEELGVRHIQTPAADDYDWYHLLNKPRALRAAEAMLTTRDVIWIDGDILCLAEPSELLLAADEDVVAAAPDQNVGTTGPGDVNEPFWRAVCQATGMAIDELPWITTLSEQKSIRFYLNSGVFTYRRTCGLGARQAEITQTLLRNRLASHAAGTFFLEQISLGLAIVQLGLRFRPLTHSHNFAVGKKIHGMIDVEALQRTCLLHYHDGMWPHYYPRLLELISHRPEARAIVEAEGPLTAERSLPRRVKGKLIKWSRKRRERRFLASAAVA